ncbi:MAG: tRNA (guanosine(46)-N7)-methyltransferase TrmB [Gammaproteobacteria bacterium]|nr:tRNA (guanosine(46)-N7)-methyltransferase TrmB [Gammaproteobacteria bacterium]
MTARRAIRSYVIRKGRMTDGQRRALNDDWPRFGLDLEDGLIDPQRRFAVDRPLTIEIGFGMGDSLFELAHSQPERNFIGIEVHPPGVGHLLIRASEAGLDNLKLFNADGIDVMRDAIPESCAEQILIFFPDPWHKKKHHKRRLLNRDYFTLLASRLQPGGIIHIATDWEPYAESIREATLEIESLEPVDPPARPKTKYEQRGRCLGHEVTDLAWRKHPTD